MRIFRRKPIREEVVQRIVASILNENGVGERLGTSDTKYAEAVSLTEEVMREATKAERQEASRRVISGDGPSFAYDTSDTAGTLVFGETTTTRGVAPADTFHNAAVATGQ